MIAPLILTAPAGQQARWRAALVEEGVACLSLPLIVVEPAPKAMLEVAWAAIARCPRLVVFVSPSAVAALDGLAGVPWPAWPAEGVAACVGPGTAQALRERGVAHVVVPPPHSERFESEALWPLLAPQDWQGAEVLILRGDGGREWLGERLAEAGAQVRALQVYRRCSPEASADWPHQLAQVQAQPSLWFLTSAQAVAQGVAAGALKPGMAALATHPKIAQAAREAGLHCTEVRGEAGAVATAWRAWCEAGAP